MSAPVKISNEFKKKYGHEISKYKLDHLYQLDRDLGILSTNLNIELMPGNDDLSTVALPQKPLPKYLFPTLSHASSVNFTSNPTIIDIESTR